jgi:wobble nucleotide-excising tRNase
MLKKILSVRNIGKFVSCSAHGDVELRKLNIVFGENGRGKTTLAAIFRSLQSGSAHYIIERQTLNGSDPPEVQILLHGGTATFTKGKWSTLLPGIEVFDQTFVHENVFAGDCIDHDQKKNLYRVIVGDEGVKLAREVDDLDVRIRDANKEINDKKIAASRYAPADMSLEEFVALPNEDTVEAKIAQVDAELSALKRAREIRGKGLLQQFSLPGLPGNFRELLAKDLGGISRTAEERVHAHLRSCMDEGGEGWIEQGLEYADKGACPFCGKPFGAATLLEDYRTYFGESYQALKQEIAEMHRAVAVAFGEQALLRLQRTIADNRALRDFWQQFVGTDVSGIAFEELQLTLEALRTSALAVVARKMAAPLEPVEPDSAFERAASEYQRSQRAVEAYNGTVDAMNSLITHKKAETEAGNQDKALKKLARLRAAARRHSDEVEQACGEYGAACQAKKHLETAKKKAKKALDEYATRIFETYQGEINDLLAKFNAGFRIDKTKGSYLGGTPSSSYEIVINGTRVELGDGKKAPGTPCFRNTLSSGDRSTLALAFFLARLHHDPRLGEKIVVFDDPVTSQDMSRMTCTRQLIWRLCETAKQVVVLSHNPHFLRNLWWNSARRHVRVLHIYRVGEHSTVTEWDIETETQGEYFQNYGMLANYLEQGCSDRRHVARCIRLVLEEYLRLKAPAEFRGTEWLGDFIGKIREAAPGTRLAAAQAILPELDNINSFAKRYHHRENPGADNEPITYGELQGYVRRTLELIGRF